MPLLSFWKSAKDEVLKMSIEQIVVAAASELHTFNTASASDRREKQVEKLVDDELERVKTQPVTDAELQKVRMELKRGKVEQLEGTLGRAEDLGENAIFYNDPNVVNTANDKLMSVTKEQIQKVARTYLVDTNRTVVTTIPKPRAGGAQ